MFYFFIIFLSKARDKIFGRALNNCLHILDDQKEPDVYGVKSLIRFHSVIKNITKSTRLSTRSRKAEL